MTFSAKDETGSVFHFSLKDFPIAISETIFTLSNRENSPLLFRDSVEPVIFSVNGKYFNLSDTLGMYQNYMLVSSVNDLVDINEVGVVNDGCA